MKSLEILSKEESKNVYRVKGMNCIYKFEKGVLYVGNVDFKRWHESDMKVNDLKDIEVEECDIQVLNGRVYKGEVYYFLTSKLTVQKTIEQYTEFDNELFFADNYFKSKEEAEICRDLIEKTIRAFKGRKKTKQECEEEIEKEYNEKVF